MNPLPAALAQSPAVSRRNFQLTCAAAGAILGGVAGGVWQAVSGGGGEVKIKIDCSPSPPCLLDGMGQMAAFCLFPRHWVPDPGRYAPLLARVVDACGTTSDPRAVATSPALSMGQASQIVRAAPQILGVSVPYDGRLWCVPDRNVLNIVPGRPPARLSGGRSAAVCTTACTHLYPPGQ